MAKNTDRGTGFGSTKNSNLNRGGSSADDAVTIRDETVIVTEETIPADQLRNVDLDADDDMLGASSAPTFGTPVAFDSADDDMLDSTASEPVMNEIRGGGSPVPPSAIGETDMVPPMTPPMPTQPAMGDGGANGAGFKEKAADVAGAAKDKASQALGVAKDKAGEVFGQATDKVKEQLSDQKDKAATGLESLTTALRDSSQCFQGSEAPLPLPLGDYANSFAGQIDKLTNYLRERDVDEIVGEVGAYARRNPTLVVGGSFLLGLALARFLKSGSQPATYGSASNNFGTAPRSGGALVPVEGTSRGTLMSRTEEGTSRFEEDALPANRPLTAHGYVPGIGVTGDQSANTGGDTGSGMNGGLNTGTNSGTSI